MQTVCCFGSNDANSQSLLYFTLLYFTCLVLSCLVTEKEEEEHEGDAVNLAAGVGNEDSVKVREVEKAEGMHFAVRFQCHFMRLCTTELSNDIPSIS